MYFLERKEPYSMPNILGNHSFPVKTYRWKTIAICENEAPLREMIPPTAASEYRVISNNPEVQNGEI